MNDQLKEYDNMDSYSQDRDDVIITVEMGEHEIQRKYALLNGKVPEGVLEDMIATLLDKRNI